MLILKINSSIFHPNAYDEVTAFNGVWELEWEKEHQGNEENRYFWWGESKNGRWEGWA